MKIYFAFLFLLVTIYYSAYSQSGYITNIQISQRTDGSMLVDIYYDLSGDAEEYNISVEASFDGGNTFAAIPTEFLEGDIAAVSPGSSKYIVWDGMGSFPNTFSTQAQFRMLAGTCPPTFTDSRDGQTYSAVQIGDQCWMSENLNFSTGSIWTSSCYDNMETNCDNYGRLYVWDTAMAGASSSNSNPSGVQGLCPPGWHVPSDPEWTELLNYLSSQGFPNNNITDGAGNALKSCRQVGSPLGGACDTSSHPRWNSNGTHHGLDEFGFSALPGGFRDPWGFFGWLGSTGYWWSSTRYSSTRTWYRSITHSQGSVSRQIIQGGRLSLRCIKDITGEPISYSLNLDIQPENSGTLSGGGNYTANSHVLITAIPNDGYVFTCWTGDVDYIDNPELANAFVTMPAYDISLSAIFEDVTTDSCPPTFIDPRDGQTYSAVPIGDQCWMSENLKYLPSVVGPNYNSQTTPYYYVYGYNGTDVNAAKATSHYQNYGVIYNHPAVLAGEEPSYSNPSGVQGICPPGWHVPSDAEWSQLISYVNDLGYLNQSMNPSGAGNALKSCMQVDSPLGGDCDTSEHPRWNSAYTHHGFDVFGFSALPGGAFWYDSYWGWGYFTFLGESGFWWTSSGFHTPSWSQSDYREIYYENGAVGSSEYISPVFGFSLRCLRDLD